MTSSQAVAAITTVFSSMDSLRALRSSPTTTSAPSGGAAAQRESAREAWSLAATDGSQDASLSSALDSLDDVLPPRDGSGVCGATKEFLSQSGGGGVTTATGGGAVPQDDSDVEVVDFVLPSR